MNSEEKFTFATINRKKVGPQTDIVSGQLLAELTTANEALTSAYDALDPDTQQLIKSNKTLPSTEKTEAWVKARDEVKRIRKLMELPDDTESIDTSGGRRRKTRSTRARKTRRSRRGTRRSRR